MSKIIATQAKELPRKSVCLFPSDTRELHIFTAANWNVSEINLFKVGFHFFSSFISDQGPSPLPIHSLDLLLGKYKWMY